MKRIKVLMVGLLPLEIEKIDGGVVAVILNLLSSFKKMDTLEVVFIAYDLDTKHEIIKEYSSNIKIHYLPYEYPVKLIDYFFNKKRLSEILKVEKPDIIHIQPATPHILRFIFLPKKNIILTQHGITSEEHKYAIGFREQLQALFKGFVEQYVFPTFKNIIFISEYNRSLFPRPDVFSEKIYNPVNPIFFSGPQGTGQINSISYVGRINTNKNLGLVLQALGLLRRENVIFNLHVVGGYKDDYYENEVNTLVREYSLADQVIFYGWQTQEQILEIHQKSRLFILPSQQEAMPVVIGEAMALGKVVLASNVGAVSEMFTDKISGFLFEKNNLDELCEVLKLLYNNHSLIEFVSVNARREAEDKFHPDKIALKTLDFYHQVINESQLK